MIKSSRGAEVVRGGERDRWAGLNGHLLLLTSDNQNQTFKCQAIKILNPAKERKLLGGREGPLGWVRWGLLVLYKEIKTKHSNANQ